MMKFYTLLSTFIFCVFANVCGQGKILLVGGGGESNGGWSDLPYARMANEAANKRVAIIDYQTGASNFLPNYFKSLGATDADNITIDSRDLADTQLMYDSLMSYDAFFFRGGNQNRYYQYYKDTRTHDAMIDKYNQGGVLGGTSAGMAIMSGVMFTSANGSTTPFDGLENLESNFFESLEDDFLPFYTDYIFDTHFVERGRHPRLMAFMAWWQKNKGAQLSGIGVDDRTALFIDENGLGTVFGTGAVAIYAGGFSNSANQLSGKDINAIQLLHGHQFNLLSKQIVTGPETSVAPSLDQEAGFYKLLLSGGGSPARNQAFLNYFAAMEASNDSILLVSRSASSLANQVESRLRDADTQVIIIRLETNSTNNHADSVALRNHIRRTKKVLFADNSPENLFDFLIGGATGELVAGHIRRDGMVVGFALDDAKLAGAFYATNIYNDPFNAYYGDLEYAEGLGLLQTSIVLPDAFSPGNNDFYENLSSAGLWGSFHKELKYVLYMTEEGFVEMKQQADKNVWEAHGRYSTLISELSATQYSITTQNVSGNRKRNQVAFENLSYHALANSDMITVGAHEAAGNPQYEFEQEIVLSLDSENQLGLKVYPNPAKDILHIEASVSGLVEIYTMRAEKVLESTATLIDISNLQSGVYVLRFTNLTNNKQSIKKLMIN